MPTYRIKRRLVNRGPMCDDFVCAPSHDEALEEARRLYLNCIRVDRVTAISFESQQKASIRHGE